MDFRFICFIFISSVFAADADSKCTAKGGECQYNSIRCAGGYVSNLCSGPSTRRCCKPPDADSKCTAKGGECQDDSIRCAGGYVSNLCSGPSTRRCCKPPGSCRGVVSRAEWKARAPKSVKRMGTPVKVLFIHHTVTNECTTLESCGKMMRSIQNYHMDNKKWQDIGYSFLVGQDGRVYEGRGWDTEGAHTKGWNDVAVAFSVMGNYMDHVPNDAAIDAINRMIQCGIHAGKLTNGYKLYGHRDAADSTDCPGTSLYNLITTWPHFGSLPPVKPTPIK